jgi:hypothetical protein
LCYCHLPASQNPEETGNEIYLTEGCLPDGYWDRHPFTGFFYRGQLEWLSCVINRDNTYGHQNNLWTYLHIIPGMVIGGIILFWRNISDIAPFSLGKRLAFIPIAFVLITITIFIILEINRVRADFVGYALVHYPERLKDINADGLYVGSIVLMCVSGAWFAALFISFFGKWAKWEQATD